MFNFLKNMKAKLWNFWTQSLVFVLKWLWNLWEFKKEATKTFVNNKGEEIFEFNRMYKVRITIGVLASIISVKNEILCHKSKRDNQWKPIGGCIKFNKNLKKQINKIGPFKKDLKTPYKGKKDDFRGYMNISTNKEILKLFRKIDTNYFHSELKREIIEELKIKEKTFQENFKIGKSCFQKSILKNANNSILQDIDWSLQFVFKTKVNKKTISKILQKNKNIKWIDLEKDNKKNISITAQWVANI